MAYQGGSVPVGALWVDAAGEIRVRGRNRIRESSGPSPFVTGTRVAHAEVNVLVQIPPEHYDAMAEGMLYTSLEPCPMCTGAIAMSGVRHVVFGARDREAGSTHLFAKSPYMARKHIQIQGPEPAVEAVSLTLMTSHLLRVNGRRTDEFLASFALDSPGAVALGRRWHDTGYLDDAVRRGDSINTLIAAVLESLHA